MRVADTPRSRCAAVFVGFNNVQGTIADHSPTAGHYTGTIAAWWRASLEHEWEVTREVVTRDAKGNETRRLETHYEFRLADSWVSQPLLWVADETGRVLLDVTTANVTAPLPYSEIRGLRLPGIGFVTGPGARPTGRWWEKEWRLHHGDPAFCLGYARIADDGASLIIDSKGDDEFLLTVQPPAAVARNRRIGTWLLMILAFGIPAALTWGTTEMAIVLPGLALLSVVWGTGIAYNRLVRIKESQQRAWSLIDVQLQRRATLIPQLASVATGYAAHEADLQHAVSAARAAGPAAWLALREAYPQLKADALFAKVADELTATENQIAAAREYFNDAVTTLRDRTQSFPGLLLVGLARSGRFGSMELIAAGGEERSVPDLRRLLQPT